MYTYLLGLAMGGKYIVHVEPILLCNPRCCVGLVLSNTYRENRVAGLHSIHLGDYCDNGSHGGVVFLDKEMGKG